MENIGNRLHKIRNDSGLTFQAFADEIGTSAGYLSNIEKGKKKISIEIIQALRIQFGVDINWLLTGEHSAGHAPINVIEFKTSDEKEYLEKLLRVLRNPETAKAIKENLNTFMKVPVSEVESPPRPTRRRVANDK